MIQKCILSHKATNIILFWTVDKITFPKEKICRFLKILYTRFYSWQIAETVFRFSRLIGTAAEILLVGLHNWSIHVIKGNWYSFNPLRQSRKQAIRHTVEERKIPYRYYTVGGKEIQIA